MWKSGLCEAMMNVYVVQFNASLSLLWDCDDDQGRNNESYCWNGGRVSIAGKRWTYVPITDRIWQYEQWKKATSIVKHVDVGKAMRWKINEKLGLLLLNRSVIVEWHCTQREYSLYSVVILQRSQKWLIINNDPNSHIKHLQANQALFKVHLQANYLGFLAFSRTSFVCDVWCELIGPRQSRLLAVRVLPSSQYSIWVPPYEEAQHHWICYCTRLENIVKEISEHVYQWNFVNAVFVSRLVAVCGWRAVHWIPRFISPTTIKQFISK